MKKICYLGAGIWSFCLASLLANKGFQVMVWSRNQNLLNHIKTFSSHPKIPGSSLSPNISFTKNMRDALENASLIVEGVSSAGLRPVCEQLRQITPLTTPFILTSKGIEQNTGLLMSEVVLEVFGKEIKKYVGCLSGPSIALEIIQGLPCSVVCSSYSTETTNVIHEAFSSPKFRVYPNADIKGVELGGALKNIIAIACGISDGLNFGDNAKAGLVTRGLHEMRRFATIVGCRPDTLNGLAGMGDLCVTCFSNFSRNYRFGKLIAQGLSVTEAKEHIGMVIEGAYTAVSAVQVARQHKIELPIAEGIYKVLYENLSPLEGVRLLMQRETKQEYL